MKLKQESRVLKQKALESLIFTVETFNSPQEGGRATRVLLHLQHAFEMLLKAALVQTRENRVFDRETGRSIGFERCVRLSAENRVVNLSETDAGTLRAIDAMRDDEQHWFNLASEQLLYLHARAGVALFDELLQRVLASLSPTTCPRVSYRSLSTRRVTWLSFSMRSTRRSRRCCGPAVAPGTKRGPACGCCWPWKRTSIPTRGFQKRT